MFECYYYEDYLIPTYGDEVVVRKNDCSNVHVQAGTEQNV